METKTIQETKATCKACGNVWYFRNQKKRPCRTFCCGSGKKQVEFWRSALSDEDTRCPKCRSAAIDKVLITHEVTDTQYISSSSQPK